jgi:hypothetical protein
MVFTKGGRFDEVGVELADESWREREEAEK